MFGRLYPASNSGYCDLYRINGDCTGYMVDGGRPGSISSPLHGRYGMSTAIQVKTVKITVAF